MALLPGVEYDIFISYRHNDNRSGWVTEFVKALQEELAATIKEPVSVYFDSNPHDGLLETHNVDKSLEGKLKCLIFIPILSQTYCDPKSFAWQHEFVAFNKISKEDQFGRDIKLSNGNVTSRILPIKIHDLDGDDKATIENEIGGVLRAIDFIYKEAGVNRPLKPHDDRSLNLVKSDYKNQVNKVANAIKEIISALKNPVSQAPRTTNNEQPTTSTPKSKTKFILAGAIVLLLIIAGYFIYVKIFHASNDSGDPIVHRTGEKSSHAKSIIVLPFESFESTKTEDDYFLDGFTSAIVTKLAKSKELSIISEAISFSYKNKEDDFNKISEELKVDYAVQGHLHRVDDKVKISIRLTDIHSGFQLWSEQYDRDTRDIFEVQDEIIVGISKTLGLKQTVKKGNSGSEITENMEAYEYYLKGKFFSNSEIEGDLDTSIFYLNKAIAADSKFALAYAEVSYVYGLKNFWFDPKGGWDVRAVVAAERAMTLDHNLPEAIFSRAFCNWTLANNFPHESVIRECNRALALAPNLDRIHNLLGLIYLHVGLLEEGLAESQIASSLDPYSGFDLATLGAAYMFLKDYKNTLHILRQIPEKFLAFSFRKSFVALALINLGRDEEAEAFLLSALKTDPKNYATNSAYAILLAKKGDRINSIRTIKIVEDAKIRANHFHHAGYNIGVAYALLNEKDKSLFWLRWSAENGFPSYGTYKDDPLLKNMQDYPPFIALLSELKTEMVLYKKLVQESKN